MILKITKTAILLVFCFFIISGCQNVAKSLTNIGDIVSGKIQLEQKKQVDKTLAIIKCQELCQTGNGFDLNTGECLSNKIIPDWVCDMAHSPRQEVDDDPANQCSAFREGEAHHFVELDGNCNIIKVY